MIRKSIFRHRNTDIPQMYEQLKQHIDGIKEPHLHRLADDGVRG